MTDVPSPDHGRSRAVLIGTWDYTTLPPVPAVKNSFQRVSRLLTSDLCGWPEDRITCLDNVRQPANLPHRLIELFDDAEDVALFYYVGHGQSDSRGRLCLGLTDTRTEAKFRASTSLKFEDVRDALHHCNAQTKIVLLDCCFAGLATSPEASLGSIDVAERASCEGAYTIAASAEFEVAGYEHDSESSELPQTHFTKHLCDIVQSGIPGQGRILTLGSIFRQMTTSMQSKQLPQPTQTNRGVATNFPFANNNATPRWKVDAEQAVLGEDLNSIFINLSRRSQSLVERQLSLIDQLEEDEQDPDQLAMLFELDHLATRMRRNTENLLILSGVGSSRRIPHSIPTADVIGAAVSEIEQYTRIAKLVVPELAIQGDAATDLVHVIAELLDNATTFSEPDKRVEIQAFTNLSKNLIIQITDEGIGMTEKDIEVANALLADPPETDVAVTRRMGLYVVARLAKRHRIDVWLRTNEHVAGGLVATIEVPSELTHKMDDRAKYEPPVVVDSTPKSDDPPTDRLPLITEPISRWFERNDADEYSERGNPPAVPPSAQRSAEASRVRLSSWQRNVLRAKRRMMETKTEKNPDDSGQSGG
jgi:signal transduction histidine kinase